MHPDELRPLAFSYLRMSTKEQLLGDSLRRQQEKSKKFAAEKGLRLLEDGDLQDIGLSGYTGANRERGAFGIFVDKVEKGEIPEKSWLLVESVDRLSRQAITQAIPVFLNLLNKGIIIATMIDGQVFDSNSDTMQLMWSFNLMALAHQESKQKADRISQSWSAKRKRILVEKLTGNCPSWLTLDAESRASFHVNEQKAEIVRNVFRLAASGYGSYALVKHLNEGAVPTLTGRKFWAKSSLEKLLKSRAVLGEFQPHKKPRNTNERVPEGVPHSDYFPPIVELDLFNQVQIQRMERRVSGAGRRGFNVANVFTGKATCENCGAPMHLIDKGSGPKGGKYLRCSGAIKSSGCNEPSWSYSKFEKSFFYFLRNEIDFSSVLKAAAVEFNNKSHHQKVADLKAEISATELTMKRRIAIADKIAELSEEQESWIASEIVELSKTVKEKRAELKVLETEFATAPQQVNDAGQEDVIRALLMDLENADEVARSRMRDLISKIVKKLTLAPRGKRHENPLYRPNQAFAGKARIRHNKTHLIKSRADLPPTFEVELSGGTVKQVGVSKDDPTAFVFIIEGVLKPEFRSHDH